MDRRRIEELADLAALDLTPGEMDRLEQELGAIAALWSALPAGDGPAAPAGSGPAGGTAPEMSPEKVEWSARTAEANAPRRAAGFFLAPDPRPEEES
ncbi:hypothetical protein KJ682_02555 [bacterium]|nr:hypothetical protein [bacterium]